MQNRELQEYLDHSHVEYTTINLTPAYTAQETAANAHISGKELAKTVIVKIDGKLAMVIEPANLKVNLAAMQSLLGAKSVELAKEYEFQDKFPGCEAGAMPPLGNLYDMDVYVDECLAEDGQSAFIAGSHSELVEMSYDDFAKLAKPKCLHLHD